MARYFFNIVNGDFAADTVGSELESLKAAREEAIRTARELMSEGVSMHGQWHHWKVVVKDLSGQTVLSVPFSECHSRP